MEGARGTRKRGLSPICHLPICLFRGTRKRGLSPICPICLFVQARALDWLRPSKIDGLLRWLEKREKKIMRLTIIKGVFSITIGFIASLSQASDPSLMQEVKKVVKELCGSPSDSGKYLDVKVGGSGDAKVKLKLIDMSVLGQAEFSKKEWQGVQSVLPKDQLEDNVSYRTCVTSLTPLFLEKFVGKVPPVPPEVGSIPTKTDMDCINKCTGDLINCNSNNIASPGNTYGEFCDGIYQQCQERCNSR